MLLSKRKKLTFIFLSAIALTALALFLWAFVIEPNRLTIKEKTIAIKNLPEQLDKLKIVAISDIHGGSAFITESKLQEIVKRTNEQQPDLIVLLGDFVSQETDDHSQLKMEIETIAKNISGFKAKYGVYAVLGNHDWWADGKRIQKALEDNGIKVLENDSEKIIVNGQMLWLLGIPDHWTRQPINLPQAMRKIDSPAPIIAITHNPDIFPELPTSITLTLAGHTHGGQVNFPFIGAPIVPSNFKQRYVAGHIIEDGKHLFVTTGIGTSGPAIRFRVPPELVVLTLSNAQ